MGTNPSPYPPAGGGFTNPMTTAGDLIDATTGGTAQRLGVGAANQVLTVSGGAPSWQNNAAGFANPMTTAGDVIIEDASPAPARLAIGATGQALQVAAGLPAWGTLPLGGGGTGQTTAQAALDALAGAQTANQVLKGNGTHVTLAALAAADLPTVPITGGGTGQVTAQAALDALAAAQTANQVLAGDGTHVTLRALAAADLPTVTIAKGGTGQVTAQAALDALAAAQTNHQVLAGDGTHVTLRALAAADLPAGTTSAQGALQLDGTAADIALSGDQAAGNSALAAAANHVHPTQVPTPGDLGLLGWAFDPAAAASTNIMTAGTLYLVKIPIHYGFTATNLWAVVSTVAAGSSNGTFIGLYNSAGTLLSNSADIGTSWNSTGPKSVALAAAQPLSGGTFVWAGILANMSSTQPTLARTAITVVNQGNINLATTAMRWAVNGTSLVSAAYTATNASPAVFTATGTAYPNGLPVSLSGGTAPTGFTNGTTYYVVSVSGTTFSLAATVGGAAINSTSTGSGTVSPAGLPTSITPASNTVTGTQAFWAGVN